MGFYTCKGKCKNLKGYVKGYRHFNVEGRYWCRACNYKIFINRRMCPCCHSPYRTRRRKDYPHLREQQEKQRELEIKTNV
jgi:hypothetical protein